MRRLPLVLKIFRACHQYYTNPVQNIGTTRNLRKSIKAGRSIRSNHCKVPKLTQACVSGWAVDWQASLILYAYFGWHFLVGFSHDSWKILKHNNLFYFLLCKVNSPPKLLTPNVNKNLHKVMLNSCGFNLSPQTSETCWKGKCSPDPHASEGVSLHSTTMSRHIRTRKKSSADLRFHLTHPDVFSLYLSPHRKEVVKKCKIYRLQCPFQALTHWCALPS